MAGERKFIVQILGNADGAVAAFKKLAKEGVESFEKVQKIGSKLGSAFDFVKKGAFIAVGGLTAVAGAATAAVAAAAADEASQKSLEGQLIRSAAATQAQVQQTEAFITKAMLATGVADDELRPAFANLARATGDLDKSQRLFNLALDISAATGRDLEAVTLGLGRAANGQIAALTRLGIPIDENAKKSKDFSSVLQQLETQFSGAAATAADTFAGRVKILKTSFGEVVETVGFLLLPAFERLVEILQKRFIPALQAAVDGFKEKGLKGAMLAFLAALGPFGISIVNTFEAIVTAVVTLGGHISKLAISLALASAAIIGPVEAFKLAKAIMDASGDAAAATAIKFDNLRNSITMVGVAMNLSGNKISPLIDSTDRLGNKVLPKAKEGTDDWTNALADLNKKAGGAAKTVETAKEKFEKYTEAIKKSTSAEKAFSNAQKATFKARQNQLEAATDLETAQANFNKAVAGFGPDSKEAKAAQRELSKAQRNVAEAGFAVEESVFAVRDAEKKLAEVRADPTSTPQAIRQAEIDLAQAKLRVADATDNQTDATTSLAKAQDVLNETVNGAIEGSDTYKTLLEALNDAKEKEASASEAVTDALEREKEAYEELAEAIRKAAEAARTMPGRNLAVPTLPTLPTVPTPTITTVPSDVRGGTQIVVNTGIGTNGVEAGRQIVDLLQQYSAVDANAIRRIGFIPRT